MTGANVLVAIFGEKDSHAVYYLHQQGVTRLDVVNFISHGVRKDPARATRKGAGQAAEQDAEGEGKQQGSRRSSSSRRISTSSPRTARSIR